MLSLFHSRNNMITASQFAVFCLHIKAQLQPTRLRQYYCQWLHVSGVPVTSKVMLGKKLLKLTDFTFFCIRKYILKYKIYSKLKDLFLNQLILWFVQASVIIRILFKLQHYEIIYMLYSGTSCQNKTFHKTQHFRLWTESTCIPMINDPVTSCNIKTSVNGMLNIVFRACLSSKPAICRPDLAAALPVECIMRSVSLILIVRYTQCVTSSKDY